MNDTGTRQHDGAEHKPDSVKGSAGSSGAGADRAASGIPIVALGGSAGALGAFTDFFDAMPADSGAVFVVIQHLAPGRESLLTELLGRHTRMPVKEVDNGLTIEPNHVYVIPPDQYMGIRDGILFLKRPVLEKGLRLPIDFFLRSLAEDRRERAVCILFSGAGSDGAAGVRAVRGTGGLTLAQDESARFEDLPRSAVATGLVDRVLPPGRMPDVLVSYLQHPYVSGRYLERGGVAPGLDAFAGILAVMREKTGCDFRPYKQSTIRRRIERRMGLNHLTDMGRYADLLRSEQDEVRQLHRDLLINVTAFFRDPDAYKKLRINVLRPLVRDRDADTPVRVWLPGCSTGEEAYSVAMLLTEELDAAGKHCSLSIFATDLDEEALQTGRAGVYPATVTEEVGKERLQKFFVRKEKGYQICEALRSSVVFAPQNLIADPPFSKMDLVCCRNLLIYLDVETQAGVIPLFNFALNPGGFLFLGKSESICGRTDLFVEVSKKARLYRRLEPPRPIVLEPPAVAGGSRKRSRTVAPPPGSPPRDSYAELIRQALLNHFSASLVLVDRHGQILRFHGQTSRYLNLPTGDPTLNVLDIAREGLSLKLRAAIHQAVEKRRPVVLDAVLPEEKTAAGTGADAGPAPARQVRITVESIARRDDEQPVLAVVFEDVPHTVDPSAVSAAVPNRDDGEAVRELEQELRTTQRDLQASIEDLQASNEELRVSNEEVISSNEELQSTNEELETSREELQSVNEELTTVNGQYQEKVASLEKSSNDISNFLEASQLATLFLDAEQRIKLFTPASTRLLKLIPSDIGRPLSDLSLNFDGYALPADVRSVIEGGPPIERDIRHADGTFYLVRVLPYRTQADRSEGAVVTFTDVSRLREEEGRQQHAAELNEAVSRINRIVHSSRDPNQILQHVLNEGCQALGSEAAALTLRESGAWTVRYVNGMPDNLVGMVVSDEQDPHALLALETRKPVAISNCDADERCNRDHMRRFNVCSVLAVPLIVQNQPLGVVHFLYHTEPHSFSEQEIQFGRQIGATASAAYHNAQLFQEISDTLAVLRNSEEQLKQTMRAGRVFTCEWEPQTDAVRRSENCADILGIDPATCMQDTGESHFQRVHDEDRPSFTELVRGLTPEVPTYEARYRFARDDGSYVWIEEGGRAEFDEAGHIVRVRCVAGDITERMDALDREKEASAAVAAARSAIEIVDAMGEGVVLFRLDGTVTAINPAIERFTGCGRQEFVGRNIRSLLPQFLDGRDLTEMMHALGAVMQGRAPKLKSVVLEREAMPPVTVSPAFAFPASASGTPVSAILTLKDVTELYRQSELLNQIFDSTHMQIVCLDNQFNIVRVNRAYADHNRRDTEFFYGKNYLEFCPCQETRTMLQEVLRTGEFFSAFEKPFASPHDPGKTTYWDYSLRPMHNNNGQQEGILLCLLDVTPRVEARQHLANTEQRYQELVQNANSIIMRVTQDQRITFFNEYAQRFFGYSEDELLGRSVVGTIVPEVDSEGRNLRKLTEEIAVCPERHRSNDNENICKDGRRVWVHWSNKALRDENGTVTELLCVGTDITERRRLAKKGEAYRRRLLELAGRLTTQEEQARCFIAADIHDTVVQKLSLANIRLGEVLAAVKKAELSGPQKRVEEVRQLLEQSNMDCRGLMDQLVPPMLYETGLAAALRVFVENQIENDSNRIVLETEDCPAPMDNALRGLLFQCARELIMNALKYAGNSEVRVSLSFSDEQVLLQVQDDGPGFDPDALNGKVRDKNGGFGLFNISQRLESLNGQLEIDSAPGRGTTAAVRVPIKW
jgi:PAS domain S-box-containing protein